MPIFRRQKHSGARYRLFFATDVHGSDRCFRKFLAAASVYDAQALVLGGDIAGKGIVPIVRAQDGGFRVRFHGESLDLSKDGLAEIEGRIRFNGLYPLRITSDEDERLASDRNHRDAVFADVIGTQVREWCDLAAARLPPDVRVLITPGNDDPLAIDDFLTEHTRVESPERRTIQVGPVWLASLGDTNRTPWDTDREFDEEALADRIAAAIDGCADGRPLVFNFHCPPFASGLDTAPELDSSFAPVVRNGALSEIPVGSTAVRDAVLAYKPVVGLHGHIHESQGVRRVGETLCINPGSDYSSGVLKGCIVDFTDDGRYMNHLMTTG